MAPQEKPQVSVRSLAVHPDLGLPSLLGRMPDICQIDDEIGSYCGQNAGRLEREVRSSCDGSTALTGVLTS